MNVSVGGRREGFIEQVVREGRYASANDVVREGLRLVEEREARLRSLRETLAVSMATGERASEGEIDDALAARSAQLAVEGF